MSNFENLVDAARNFACDLYRQQPGALIPNVGNSVLRFAWDKLCDYPDNPGLPPPPSPPFTGGQCECVIYKVNWTLDCSDNRFDTPGSVFCFAPVVAMRFTNFPDGSAGTEIYCRGTGVASCSDFGWYPGGLNFAANFPFTGTVSINSVSRADNQVDNCGNPPESYPPPTVPVPPDGYTSPPQAIPLADGTNITVNFNFSPPTTPSLPEITDFIPPIVVNIVKPELKIPIEFNFNGEINIGVPSTPPVALPPEVYTELEEINNNVNNIELEFNDYRKDYDFFFNPPKLDDDPETNKEDDLVEEGKEEDKEGIVGLRIELTKLPDKAQFGSPTVYFAGWMAFKREQGYLPREQINFANSFFLAPPGCTGYTVTFTNGAQGNIRVYSRENES